MEYVSSNISQKAKEVPALSHQEAGEMATAELEQTLLLLDTLTAENWQQPTACLLWNVQEMTAHLTGACAGHASWAEFKRQYLQNSYQREAKMKVDGINRRQVEDRANCTPQELIAELRDVGPKAIRTRQRLPGLLRIIPIPFGPPLGTTSIGYLTDLIYIRDMWMHRLDICRVTGHEMKVSPDHDGRIIALVMRDVGRKLDTQLEKKGLAITLTGPAGGTFYLGSNQAEDTAIKMDALDFNWRASGRMTPKEATNQATITGSPDLAQWFFENCDVPY